MFNVVQLLYDEFREAGNTAADVMTVLGIGRICCRTAMLTTAPTLDDALRFDRTGRAVPREPVRDARFIACL
jgi:DNA-directed RNA polymerase subunit N (RpoN/RPB10)